MDYETLWLTMWFHAKKSKETLKKNQNRWFYNRWFYNVNMAPELKNDQKSLKKTDHLIAIYSFFCIAYGIFWMPPGEFSHPGGSEYVWQRGVEGVLGWVTGGRSWPYFQKKNQLKWAVAKNSPGHNFQNIASKLNQRGLIVYEPMLIQFGSDILKIVAGGIFFYGS